MMDVPATFARKLLHHSIMMETRTVSDIGSGCPSAKAYTKKSFPVLLVPKSQFPPDLSLVGNELP